jgi:hypothetical protein
MNQKNSWEEELKPKMKYAGIKLDKDVWNTLQELLDYYWEELKPQIRQLLQSRKQQIKEEVENMKKDVPLGLNPEEYKEIKAYNSVYNQAIDDIIKYLEKYV